MRLLVTFSLVLFCAGCAHSDGPVSVPSHWRFDTEDFSLGLKLVDEKRCLAYAIHHKRDGVGSDCVYRVSGNSYHVTDLKSDGSLHKPQKYKFIPAKQVFRYTIKAGPETFTFELRQIED